MNERIGLQRHVASWRQGREKRESRWSSHSDKQSPCFTRQTNHITCRLSLIWINKKSLSRAQLGDDDCKDERMMTWAHTSFIDASSLCRTAEGEKFDAIRNGWVRQRASLAISFLFRKINFVKMSSSFIGSQIAIITKSQCRYVGKIIGQWRNLSCFFRVTDLSSLDRNRLRHLIDPSRQCQMFWDRESARQLLH